ncbi:UPF0764 protein C16orf89 homolog [Sitophilus oryzae]|uniref:UPF0764 protein C16orf89 homolog n=1 Tax=Sitophilus oryzae TaxID=7048 RepID=A0A6J2XK14_SITOR|nr:UPF0764 protein C16orf89 homolog [Sitophilus oryzae]
MGVTDEAMCRFCQSAEQTTEHKFMSICVRCDSLANVPFSVIGNDRPLPGNYMEGSVSNSLKSPVFKKNVFFRLCSWALLDYRTVTVVRHGLETSLDYIEKNLYKSNVDCSLGVAFVRAFMRDAYQNGSHIMDKSTQNIFSKSAQIIEQSRTIFGKDPKNGNDWKFKYLVDEDIWSKRMKYKPKNLLRLKYPKLPVSLGRSPNFFDYSNTDVCLLEIVNNTQFIHNKPMPCMISKKCWNYFLKDWKGSGYIQTHKLLLLQIAKARKCSIDEELYEVQNKDICSIILTEIVHIMDLNRLDGVFDLFLEQVLLCGYEGYKEFFQSNWLYHIIKAQKGTGCFPDKLGDNLKSRVKKAMTYFDDGCNDHSTGLGAAVLGLYYNYLVKESFV